MTAKVTVRPYIRDVYKINFWKKDRDSDTLIRESFSSSSDNDAKAPKRKHHKKSK